MAADTNGALFRDFDAEVAETEGAPITFKVGGTVFHCVHPLPVGKVLVMARHAGDRFDLAIQAKAANVLWDFVEPAEHEALDEAISKLTNPEVMTNIMEFIMVASTGRPTEGS